MGIALIYGVTGILNFSIGAIGVFGAFLTWLFLPQGFGVALTIGLGTSFAIGYLLQRILLNHVLESRGNDPSLFFIITFAIAMVFSGLTKIIFPRPTISFVFPKLGVVDIAGVSMDANRFVAIFVAVGILVVMRVLEKYTRAGKSWVATSQNLKLAKLTGINVNQVFSFVAGIGITLGYVGALFWGGLYNLTVITGWDLCFMGYIIAVVGGIGNIWGGIISAVVMGLIMSYAGYLLGGMWQSVVLYGMLFLVLIISPKGILGSERSI
jgi:branched-chain amino acid transport system permease protein